MNHGNDHDNIDLPTWLGDDPSLAMVTAPMLPYAEAHDRNCECEALCECEER